VRSEPVDDLTARARIRDAALLRFARDGFGAGLRAIAADAQVSPALVIHHFGSKDGLRAACDAHVLDRIRSQKEASLTTETPREVMAHLADLAQYGPVFGYVIRSLAAGGPLAARFVEDMVSATADYLAVGVAAGTVSPSRDPEARARYVVAHSVGLLQMALIEAEAGRAPSPTLDPVAAFTELARWATGPALEIYTEPLLTDRSLLDVYLGTVVQEEP
jgi:AcrR family transcriptional regulator